MTEGDLKIFIRGTENFFTRVTKVPATIGTPYIMEDDRVVYDFSAVIGVSGSQRGCVYYSAPRAMIEELVKHLGETMTTDAILADYVGEIANTVAGNARKDLGSSFMISYPVVFSGAVKGGDVHFPRGVPAFVIPLDWQGHQSSLIICLEENITADLGHAIDFSAIDDDLEPAER